MRGAVCGAVEKVVSYLFLLDGLHLDVGRIICRFRFRCRRFVRL